MGFGCLSGRARVARAIARYWQAIRGLALRYGRLDAHEILCRSVGCSYDGIAEGSMASCVIVLEAALLTPASASTVTIIMTTLLLITLKSRSQ